MEINNEAFRLKVESIVYEVLNKKELTVKEVKNIKEAMKEIWDLLIERHCATCSEARRRNCEEHIQRVGELERDSHSTPCPLLVDIRNAFDKWKIQADLDSKHNQNLTYTKIGIFVVITSTVMTILASILIAYFTGK